MRHCLLLPYDYAGWLITTLMFIFFAADYIFFAAISLIADTPYFIFWYFSKHFRHPHYLSLAFAIIAIASFRWYISLLYIIRLIFLMAIMLTMLLLPWQLLSVFSHIDYISFSCRHITYMLYCHYCQPLRHYITHYFIIFIIPFDDYHLFVIAISFHFVIFIEAFYADIDYFFDAAASVCHFAAWCWLIHYYFHCCCLQLMLILMMILFISLRCLFYFDIYEAIAEFRRHYAYHWCIVIYITYLLPHDYFRCFRHYHCTTHWLDLEYLHYMSYFHY